MSVEIAGVQVVGDLRGRQVRALLAYLILNRTRTVGREELSVAVWPDRAPQSQDAALRTLLSRLRTAVGPSVLTGRDQLALTLPEPVWVDLEAARTQIERAMTALGHGDLRTAWALGQVPLNVASRGLLPGVQATWLEPARRELEELRQQALEVIGRAGLGLGGSQLASAERAARALIATEPYRESAYVLLMEALAAQGNIAEGLRVFEQLRSLLNQELGTVPSPEALAVHEGLLNPQPRQSAVAATGHDAPEGTVELPAELASRALAPLVGRVGEMVELERLWELARTGRIGGPQAAELGAARVLVLAGDPGVGKTRLVAELARRVHAHGAVVLAGRAPEESLVPYQPFLEALRHYVVNAPLSDLRAAASDYGSELARLVPELRRRVPDLVSSLPVEPDTERYRMFEAVVGLLSAISRSAPILLVLDDLHWADRPTLLLLRHLARARDPRRLLILAAYRSTEEASAGMPAMLADLQREQLLVEHRIEGLSEPETAELVRLRTGEVPTHAFVHALHSETEGNPLFIEEIVRHLTEAGVRPGVAAAAELQRVGLPEGVKQVIARRLSRLDPPAIEWLRTAAVIGRDFDAELLERVLGVPEGEFLDLLDEVLDTSLVSETAPGCYGFSHALIRETLYEGMSAPRRARLHRRVGEALEAAGGPPNLAVLAHHFTRAATPEDAAKAIRYARDAGEQAMAALGHEEAAEHYIRAVEVLERFMPDDEALRCELLLLQGEAQVRAGDPAVAHQSLRDAADIAERLGDGAALARAAIAASRRYLQQPGVVDEELIALLERALAATRGERTTTRVLLLARLCGALYFSPGRARMQELSAEAAEIAAELDDPEARVYACAARRRAMWDPAHLDDRLAASTEMLMRARETGNLEHQLQAHAWLVVDLLERGDLEAVDAQIEAFSAGAARLRQPLFLWNAMVWRGMRAMLSGQLDLAESLATETVAAGASAESVAAPQYYAIQMLALRREQDRMAELAEPARAFADANPGRKAWEAALIDLLIRAGREAEARERFAQMAADEFRDIPQDGDWMTAVTLLTDVATALGDAKRAERLYALLLPYQRQNVVIGLAAVCLGSCRRYLGKLAGTIGRRGDAIEHLEAALEANERLGAVIEVAHTRLDLAERLGAGRRAAELIDAAARAGEEHALPLVARRAAALRGG
jgi:DNA-binding SARP family transcriptional activator